MYITTSTEKRIRYSVTMRTIQYGLVNSAMRQIPCSTERISCFKCFYWSIQTCLKCLLKIPQSLLQLTLKLSRWLFADRYSKFELFAHSYMALPPTPDPRGGDGKWNLGEQAREHELILEVKGLSQWGPEAKPLVTGLGGKGRSASESESFLTQRRPKYG